MKAQSAWISEAHGKLGGSVFRSTRHGMVLSSKRSPTVRPLQISLPNTTAYEVKLWSGYKPFYSSAAKGFKRLPQWAYDRLNAWHPPHMTPFQYYIYLTYSYLQSYYSAIAIPSESVLARHFNARFISYDNYIDESNYLFNYIDLFFEIDGAVVGDDFFFAQIFFAKPQGSAGAYNGQYYYIPYVEAEEGDNNFKVRFYYNPLFVQAGAARWWWWRVILVYYESGWRSQRFDIRLDMGEI